MSNLNFRVFARNQSAKDFFGDKLNEVMEYDEECVKMRSEIPIWTIKGECPFDKRHLIYDMTYRECWRDFTKESQEENETYSDIVDIEEQFANFVEYLLKRNGFKNVGVSLEFDFFESFIDFEDFLNKKKLISYDYISYDEHLELFNDEVIYDILKNYDKFDVDNFSYGRESEDSSLIYIFDEKYCVSIGCFFINANANDEEDTTHVTQNKTIEREEEKKMKKMNLFKEEIGKIKDGMVALTMSGEIAVKREDGDYVRYDAKKQEMQNQMEFVLDIGTDFLMLVPVQTVEVGDIIKANGTYSQVISITKGGKMSAISFNSGTEKTFVKETNIMGMSFYFKVMNLLGGNMFGGNPTDNNPMGAMLPFLLLGKDKGGESKMDITTLMLLSNMGDNGGMSNMMSNPLMMASLLGGEDNSMSEMLPFILMGNMNKPAAEVPDKTE